MTPDDNSSSQDGASLLPQRPGLTVPQRDPVVVDASQQAAANVVRSQIDALYGQTPTSPEPTSPYEQTHSDTPEAIPDQWQQYHSAWQTYYQKYYEGYYTHHLAHAQQTLQQTTPTSQYFGSQPAEAEPTADEPLSKDEALFDLRQKLLTSVQASAKKVRHSRHFIPILAGLIVVLIFVFLQYNRFFIATVEAYVVPGNSDPQDLLIDPTADTDVGPTDLLIIPKIGVTVPTIYNVGTDYNSQMAAMVKGVANFPIPGASSRPGQIGNTVFAGHSSNDITDVGDFKYIFAKLSQLDIGDTIYIDYNSVRYTYTVTKTQVVAPTDVSALVYPTTQPTLTLLTCTPLGTALNRLLVTATQISPDPTTASAAPNTASGKAVTSIPGNSPTFLQKIFGG